MEPSGGTGAANDAQVTTSEPDPRTLAPDPGPSPEEMAQREEQAAATAREVAQAELEAAQKAVETSKLHLQGSEQAVKEAQARVDELGGQS